MERVKRKKIPISRRIIASLLAVFMAVTAIITGMSPVTAKAEGSNYTLISLGEERWYDDVFSGYDDSMGHWKTYHFTVQDDYGNEYEAICVEPHKDTPRESETFTATKEYGTDDIEARVMFWAVGAGWDDEEWGVLKDYPYELRWIIAHHTIALANGQDDWNTPLNGNGTFLGDGEGKLGWELCQKLLNIAANISPSSVGYECSLTYLSNDARVNQNLGVYNDTPVKELTGSVRFNKESAMPSISDGNSCYSLAGAEISIYSDADCTDLLETLTTGEDGYTDYYSTTFREGDSVTLYFKETKAPKGFFINDEVRSITLDSEDSYTETITDMPGNDPISLVLSKRTADGHGSGNTRLEGAEYTVKYYDTISDTDPAQSGSTAKYTWVFKTDEKGRIQLTPDYLLSGSDGLITNFAYSYTIPIGTITIQETKAPEGYLLNDTVYVAKTDVRCAEPFARHTRENDYRMLGRLKQDCEYFLGYGAGNEDALYYKNVAAHCDAMEKLWNSFSEADKPEWLSMEDINEYRHVMTKALEDKEKNNLTACVYGLTAALDASNKVLEASQNTETEVTKSRSNVTESVTYEMQETEEEYKEEAIPRL